MQQLLRKRRIRFNQTVKRSSPRSAPSPTGLRAGRLRRHSMKARKLPIGPLINPLELTVVMHSLSLGLTAFAVAAVLTAAGGSFALGQKADVPAVAQIDITEIDRDFFGFRRTRAQRDPATLQKTGCASFSRFERNRSRSAVSSKRRSSVCQSQKSEISAVLNSIAMRADNPHDA
jgi:hypothetical protein